ncbi:hypothetical protein TUBRATIS_002780 [Tubulinosema ratisbonensis]|uniref:Uncharacterized protein n=1 Tax=Tubulinosema ratisbonensis TaxID=291195 RepID=A0A437APN3_9MICR|nr:hypothetical protein TUBRATIS_002780 [Tubulinosema ratisbonensis]
MLSKKNLVIKECCKNIEKIIDNIIDILNMLKQSEKSIEIKCAEFICAKQKMLEIKSKILALFKNLIQLKYLKQNNVGEEKNTFDLEKKFNLLLKNEFNFQ